MYIIIYLNLISYYASFSFVSIPLKRDNVLLGDTYTAGMDNSQLAGFVNPFRVRGSTHPLHLLQVLAADFQQVPCTCKLCMYFFHDDPPSANPAGDSKLLDVVIHLAASVGKLIRTEPIIHKYATTTVRVK